MDVSINKYKPWMDTLKIYWIYMKNQISHKLNHKNVLIQLWSWGKVYVFTVYFWHVLYTSKITTNFSSKGAFTNYVNRIWDIFYTLPPPCERKWTFWWPPLRTTWTFDDPPPLFSTLGQAAYTAHKQYISFKKPFFQKVVTKIQS